MGINIVLNGIKGPESFDLVLPFMATILQIREAAFRCKTKKKRVNEHGELKGKQMLILNNKQTKKKKTDIWHKGLMSLARIRYVAIYNCKKGWKIWYLHQMDFPKTNKQGFYHYSKREEYIEKQPASVSYLSQERLPVFHRCLEYTPKPHCIQVF